MNFTQMEHFVHLSETLSFSKTAILMGTTQPSISRQIRDLEAELGVQLFIRDKHSVQLSEAGKAFLVEIKPWLKGFDELIQKTKDQSQKLGGQVRIGCLPEIGKNYFYKKILAFKELYPEIQIHVQYLLFHEILAKLRNGDLDFGISIQPQMSENFRSYRIYQEEAILVTRRECKLFDLVKKDPKKITELPFIGYSPVDSLLNDYLKSFFAPADISKLKHISSVNSHQSMIDYLLRIDSFAVIPSFSVDSLLQSKHLKICSDKKMTHPFYLLEMEKVNTSKKETLFKKFMNESRGVTPKNLLQSR